MTPGVRKRLIQITAVVLVQAAALFVSAGKWNWWNVWVYLGEYLIYLVINAAIILQGHKDLAEERSQVGPGAKGWDKFISLFSTVCGLAILVLAGLDERFSWTGSFQLGIELAAFVLLGLSYPLFTWAMVSNRFFSTVVRIQPERGHTVQTGGPYRFIRHPGYASLLLTYICQPFALGSTWACIPMLLLVLTLILRTFLEDRTLQKELDGYQQYAGKVRFRLIPGVW